MRKKTLCSFLAIVPMLFTVSAGIGHGAEAKAAGVIALSAPAEESVHINPIPGISPSFIRGADISMLKQLEEKGAKFYDNGQERDHLDILKDRGVNWIRLRIWNNPANGNLVLDSEGKPLGVGGGYNDLQTTVELAKRAKAKGFKVLLDFHYSDFWADPGKQYKPYEWKDVTGPALEKALYTYTDQVLKAMKAEQAMPDMVQIGNELNNGMVWNDGKTWQQTAGETIGGYDGFAGLLKQGVKAVRDNDPNAQDPSKKIKVMIHLADGGDNELYHRVFDALTARQLDYDIIGFSYYPYWHGTMDRLQHNLNDISKRYNKEVLVAEVAYAYTLDNGDSLSNNFGENEQNEGGYRATVQGQAQLVRDVMEAVTQVPDSKGLGIFYWEPDWIPVNGAGWREGEGNGWDNQAMFDFQGHALASLNVFNVSSSGTVIPAMMIGIRPVEATVALETEVTLPPYVKADFSDHSVRKYPVVWDTIDPQLLMKPNTFTVNGTINANGETLLAKAVIKVEGLTNYVGNPGFEKGSFEGWTISGDTSVFRVKNESSNAYSGDYSIHYWSDKTTSFTVRQTITGLKNGTYTLKARTQGDGGEKLLQLFASEYGGETKTADIVNTKWHEWKTPVISEIQVTNGQLTIGVNAEIGGGNWGNIDDFELVFDESAQTLAVPADIVPGAVFTAKTGVKRQPSQVYAQDVSIEYDSSLFELLEAKTAEGTDIVSLDHRMPGILSLLASTKGGIAGAAEPVQLMFKAKTLGTGAIKVTKAAWGTAPNGQVHKPAHLADTEVTVRIQDQGDGDDDGSGEDEAPAPSAPQGNGRQQASEPGPSKPNEAGIVSIPAIFDAKLGRATAQASLDTLTALAQRLKEQGGSQEARITVELPKVEGAKRYALELPAQWFNPNERSVKLDIVTPHGILSVPSGMLGTDGAPDGERVDLSIGEADVSALPADVKARIGGRPVVQLNLHVEGKPVAWNNPDSAVTVQIPYKPGQAEAANTEQLTIWYVSPSGELAPIPNAKYDSFRGSMIFSTTHFSDYAIAYEPKTFPDVSQVMWAKEAIDILASKGVVTGTDTSVFTPDAKVTRADFVVMLVRALGLTAGVETNFSDVAESDYYYEEVGIAKKLGIVNGKNVEAFAPNEIVSREDLMVIAARAMQAAKLQPAAGNGVNLLDEFEDRASIADYAVQAVGGLVQAGIVNGREGGIAPKEPTTRAEAAVIVYRLISRR
ncbi:glycosyl hydrolase 53 family protein [Paenibacillus chartarius]|uniref:Arabinogalactan endo-beta-1,4-galactanase n=1 Tax=Paenibacillus chartarius TaxID=747481 RepID=A0ABV6DPK1_9BACL